MGRLSCLSQSYGCLSCRRLPGAISAECVPRSAGDRLYVSPTPCWKRRCVRERSVRTDQRGCPNRVDPDGRSTRTKPHKADSCPTTQLTRGVSNAWEAPEAPYTRLLPNGSLAVVSSRLLGSDGRRVVRLEPCRRGPDPWARFCLGVKARPTPHQLLANGKLCQRQNKRRFPSRLHRVLGPRP